MEKIIIDQIDYLYHQAITSNQAIFSVPITEICSNPKPYILAWARMKNIKIDILDSWGSIEVKLL